MNVATIFDNSIAMYGTYNMLHFEGKWYTNSEMQSMANRLGNALKALGIQKGDRITTQLPNCAQILAVIHASLKIGAVIVPMNPMLRPDQISHIYRDSGAKVTITTSDFMPWVKEAQKGAPDLTNIIVIDRDDVPGTLYFDKLLSEQSGQLPMQDMDNDDLATLIYTSGTTGNPKGVMHTHYSMWTSVTSRFCQAYANNSITLCSSYKMKNLRTHEEIEETLTVTGLNRGE